MPKDQHIKPNTFSAKILIKGLTAVWQYTRPYKGLVLFLVFLSLITAAFEAFVPLLAGKIFDAIVSIAQNPVFSIISVFSIIAIWFALKIISDIANWRIDIGNRRLGAVLEAEYIAKAFGKLFELPIGFHKNKKHGEIGNSIIRSSGWIESVVSRVSISLLPNFLSIVIALIIMFSVNTLLAFILVGAVMIYAALLVRTAPRMATLQVKIHKAYNQAFGRAYDALGNIQEIKHAATEDYEQHKIENNFIKKAAPLWMRSINIFTQMGFAQRVLVTLSQTAVFVISVFLIKNGTITPGELVAFNGYAAMMFGPFVILGQNWNLIQNGLVEITKAEKILNTPPEKYIPLGATSPKHLEGSVLFKNVSFSYEKNGEKEVLKNISMDIKPGEKIALVGGSGVGKTTLISLLLGLYAPQKGTIRVDGIDLRKIDLKAYRSRIGVVPQEPTLFNDTVENNITYGTKKKGQRQIEEAAQQAHADEFIQKFKKKYKQLVGWRGIKLSTGQKQRIALARAFLKGPDILVLDEPTSALDAHSEELIKNSFKKLMEGRTTFIIAHRLSTVREADKILVFENGTIVERGTHEELIQKPNGVYQKLYHLQTELH